MVFQSPLDIWSRGISWPDRAARCPQLFFFSQRQPVIPEPSPDDKELVVVVKSLILVAERVQVEQ